MFYVNNKLSEAQKLSFKDCAHGLRISTGVVQLFIWSASVVLAFKYQLVASNMEKFITGNISSHRKIKITKIFFATLWAISIVYFIMYMIESKKKIEAESVIKEQKLFIYLGAIFLLILFLSYLKSLI
jgi:hypothetical protein